MVMTKAYIDEQTYNEVLESLKLAGLNDDIIKTATAMDLDVVCLFYEKIIRQKSLKNVDVVVKSMLGVYGNYLASCYYEGLGFKVQKEVPIVDKTGNKTKADLLVTDKNGDKIYCEVKTTSQIIASANSYVDADDSLESKKSKLKRYQRILVYKSIGTKLIKQVKKLSDTGNKVNVVIFNNCVVDETIMKNLSSLNVQVVKLFPDVNQLENALVEMVNKFIKGYDKMLGDDAHKKSNG